MIGLTGKHYGRCCECMIVKLVKGIKTMYFNTLACVRVQGGESKCFKIGSGMKQGCIMSPWLFNVYMDAVIKDVKVGIGARFLE